MDEELQKLLDDTLTTLAHARIFITSKEKMYPDGIVLYDELVAKLLRRTTMNKMEKQEAKPDLYPFTAQLEGRNRKMESQGAEFDTLKELIQCYHNLPTVVDDDYPEHRHYYESALKAFIDALRNNGRLPEK